MFREQSQLSQAFIVNRPKHFAPLICSVNELLEKKNMVLCKTMRYSRAYKKMVKKYFVIRYGEITFLVEQGAWSKKLLNFYPRTDFYTTKKDAKQAAKRGAFFLHEKIGFYVNEPEPQIEAIEDFFTQ